MIIHMNYYFHCSIPGCFEDSKALETFWRTCLMSHVLIFVGFKLLNNIKKSKNISPSNYMFAELSKNSAMRKSSYWITQPLCNPPKDYINSLLQRLWLRFDQNIFFTTETHLSVWIYHFSRSKYILIGLVYAWQAWL